MADTEKSGPAIAETVAEVQASFASEEAMHGAVALLTTAGFDRADLSLPKPSTAAADSTPNESADNPMTDTDTRQARTLGTSMAGTIGAFAAAGATVATGGAVGLAVAAAAAVGVGSAALANAGGNAAGNAQSASHEASAARGELVLSVRTTSADKVDRATTVLREAGAERIAAVSRTASGIDAASWTG